MTSHPPVPGPIDPGSEPTVRLPAARPAWTPMPARPRRRSLTPRSKIIFIGIPILIVIMLLICFGAAALIGANPLAIFASSNGPVVVPPVASASSPNPDEPAESATPTADATTEPTTGAGVAPDTDSDTDTDDATTPAPQSTMAPISVNAHRLCRTVTGDSDATATHIASNRIVCSRAGSQESRDVNEAGGISAWCGNQPRYDAALKLWFCAGSSGRTVNEQICQDAFGGAGWSWTNTNSSDAQGFSFRCQRHKPGTSITVKAGSSTLKQYCRDLDSRFDTSVAGSTQPVCVDRR